MPSARHISAESCGCTQTTDPPNLQSFRIFANMPQNSHDHMQAVVNCNITDSLPRNQEDPGHWIAAIAELAANLACS